jgi:plastocyanin
MINWQFAAIGLSGFLLALPGLPSPASADEPPTIEVTIKNHQFSPAEIHVPAGKPVILHINNADQTAEEFDSSALKVEKVIAGGTYGTVRLRPLGAGRYPFMGEYHAQSATGVVISE